MATSSSADSSVSISSLLASCGLGSSHRSSHDARPAASIQYKDRLYRSASRALEDYIVDYEAARTGKITVRPSASTTGKPHLSDRHQKSLTRSRYVPRDPDLLSLTTDDLLGFPSDGSLPYTEASERKRRKPLKKPVGFSPHVSSLPSPLSSSSLRGTDVCALDLRGHRLRSQELQRRQEKSQWDHVLQEAENHSVRYSNMLHSSYPHWLTSQKSELGVSGLTSIPDVKHPVWLRDYRLLDDERTLHRDAPVTEMPNYPSGSSSPGSLDSLQIPRYDQRSYKTLHSGTFADSIKRSAWTDLDIMQHLHTPVKNRPEQRSEQAAGVTHKDSSPLPNNNQSPRTEDVLEAERSWEKVPYTYKSPVHVLCEDEESKGLKALKSSLVEDFLKDCVHQENATNTFSGGNHHGPVEALKHILFNLQTFQQNFNPETSSEPLRDFQKISTEAKPEIQTDQEVFPVNKSLQKALQHLSRLKELVVDCNLKKEEDDKQDPQT